MGGGLVSLHEWCDVGEGRGGGGGGGSEVEGGGGGRLIKYCLKHTIVKSGGREEQGRSKEIGQLSVPSPYPLTLQPVLNV